jgi:hypothetical protein
MKRSIKTLCLLAFVLTLTTSYAVRPEFKTKPVSIQVSYYWFDATNTWLGRQNTSVVEMALTGLDESTHNPKTLQEKGWAAGNVILNQWGVPVPITPVPDKLLYSHP